MVKGAALRAVTRGPCPSALDGPESVGGRETADAALHYAGAREPYKSFDHQAYSRADVKAALESMFHRKCAYCESYYGATQPQDVEHYRPKGRVVDSRGDILRPGYFWLAAEWSNLLPSCIDCNRSRQQDVEGQAELAGKADKFPLVDERQRARAPGEEKREQPLLLDPCRDAVEGCFEFTRDGYIRAAATGSSRNIRADETIRILGLNRAGLVDRREWRLISLAVTIRHVQQAVLALAAEPNNMDLERKAQEEMKELLRLVDPVRAEYTLMVRQRIRADVPGLPV